MDDACDLFDCSNLVFMAQNNISTIKHLAKIIKGIEKQVKSQVRLRKEFLKLTTIPGIGLMTVFQSRQLRILLPLCW
jgi:hypothetical protein